MNTRTIFISIFLLILIVSVHSQIQAQDQGETIHLIKFDATVNPITRDYVAESVKRANQENAVALIIQLDTPGGLLESTRDIVARIMESEIPVIVYVAPAGARAGSAGVFITLAADIAAMADSTNIGAAHPVGLSGTAPDEEQDPAAAKAVNDAVAFIKSIAEKRNRNVDWAERAVRESASITAREALDLNVIDLMADNLTDLTVQLNGYVLSDGRILHTEGATVQEFGMSFRQQVLNYLADPNLVFVLFLVGLYGIIYELFSPGIGFGLAVGAPSLLLAFLGLQVLPINIVGIALILVGAILMVLDVFTPTNGILTVGGIISTIVGGFTLFNLQNPVISLSWWSVAVTVGAIALVFSFVISKALLIQRRTAATGPEGMIGEVGVAKDDLLPRGMISVHGEYWKAVNPYDDEEIRAGDEIVVESVQGSRLSVKKRS